jgi:hypothetical protein
MTENELDLYLGQQVVVHIESGDVVRGTFLRGRPHMIQASAKHGISVAYDVLSQGPDGPVHTMLGAGQIERIELAGLDRQKAGQRLLQFQTLARKKGLTVSGYMPATGVWILADFKAGPVMLEPNPGAPEVPHDSQFRIWYTSWDGLRRRDVTEMGDDDFVAFMAAEPEGLTELKG